MSDPCVVSRLVTSEKGKTYLEVDGRPFLYNAVQSWYPPEGDYEVYMQKTAEVGYRVFTFWLCWRNLEKRQGEFDWTELNRIIDQAVKYDLRLDIVWGGTNFCAHLDRRFAPDWVLDNGAWILKKPDGSRRIFCGGDMGDAYAIDVKNREILEAEKNAVRNLMRHLLEYDKSHRTILFQVENEVNCYSRDHNDRIWTGQRKEDVLAYCNEIGGEVKRSEYKIATRMNLVFAENDAEVDALPNIDFHGPDPYSDEIAKIRSVIYDTRRSIMPHIAENAAYENSTSLMVAAFAGGGFYNIYRLDYDRIWKKPGIFNENWQEWKVTKAIRNLNTALNKVAALVAVTPRGDMLEFNTETDRPLADYCGRKTLGGKVIGFRGSGGNSPVGMVIHDRGEFYCLADDDAVFVFDVKPAKCAEGFFNKEGDWKENYAKSGHETQDGWEVDYKAGECLRII